jgi:hypothetical protein
MNRVIAMLILGVLLTAMVLIVANYMSRPDVPANYAQEETVPSVAVPAPQDGNATQPENVDLRSMLQKPAAVPEDLPETVDGGLPQPEPVAPGAATPGSGENASVPAPPAVDLNAVRAAAPQKDTAQDDVAAVSGGSEEPVKQAQPAAPSVAEKNQPAAAAPVVKKEPPVRKTGAITMEASGFRFDGSKLIFYVRGSRPFEHSVFTLSKPDRLVVDVKGAWTKVSTPQTPSNRLVKNTRSGVYKDHVRFVLDLKAPLVSHTAKMQGNELVIIMN